MKKLLSLGFCLFVSSYHIAAQPFPLMTKLTVFKSGTTYTVADSVNYYYSGTRGGEPKVVLGGISESSINFANVFYDSAVNMIYKSRNLINYDVLNRPVQHITQDWKLGYVNREKQDNIYNTAGFLAASIHSVWQLTGLWKQNIKDTFEYDISGNMVKSLHQMGNGTIWGDIEQHKYNYTSGKLVSHYYEYWSNNLSVWVMGSNDYYFYDVTGKLIQDSILYSSGFENHFYIYDISGKLIVDSVTRKNGTTSPVNNYYKRTYAYNVTGDMVQKAQSMWNVNTHGWEPPFVINNNYNSNHDIISSELNPTRRTAYSYNSFNQLIQRNIEAWDTVSLLWRPVDLDTLYQFKYGILPLKINTLNNQEIKVGLYPNPTTSFVTIHLFDTDDINLMCAIYNNQGALVKQVLLFCKQGIAVLPVTELTNGNYTISMNSDKIHVAKQFTVMR